MPALDYPLPELVDESLRLRRWTFDDLACIAEASSDARIPQGTSVPVPYSDEEGRAFVERQWSRHTNGEGLSLAIATADDDVAVGIVVLLHRPQPGNVGVGYWIVGTARGRGYATRAVRLMTDWALDAAGIERIEAWVEPDNTASRRLLEAAGFDLEGRLRSFLVFPNRRADALSYSRIATRAHEQGSLRSA